MNHSFHHIIFDLDGTITDSSEGIINSVLYALQKIGIRENDTEKIKQFIGPPLSESLQLHYGLSEKEAREAVPIYREYFSAKGIYENRLYPGARETLQELHRKGLSIYMATSKPTVYTHQILKHFAINPYFRHLVGASLNGQRVHKPDIIRTLLEEQPSIDKNRAVMVGDRKYDIAGAHQNGLKAIGITWGYGSVEELYDQKPFALVGSFEELMMFFE